MNENTRKRNTTTTINTTNTMSIRSRSSIASSSGPSYYNFSTSALTTVTTDMMITPETTITARKRERKRRSRKQRKFIPVQLMIRVGLGLGCCCLLVCLFAWSTFSNSKTTTQAPIELFQLVSESATTTCETPLSPDEIAYSLVTQLSHNRMWMMEYHCQRWTQHMSIAILSHQTHEQVMDILVEELKCSRDQVTLSVLDATKYHENDYPVNVLRNLAFAQVNNNTSHAVYVDVDFWESEDMYEVLMQQDIRTELANDHQLALVLPAFQLHRQCQEWKECPEDNIPQMPYSVKDLADMITNKRGSMFDPFNKDGHGSTLYKKWIHQASGELLELDCLKSNRYEPFLVVRVCHELPPFQEQFTGYGKNKMTWMMQLTRMGYRLSQVGGVFLVHYPHLDSKSRMTWNEAPKELIDTTDKGQKRIRRPPKKEAGSIDFDNFKRGQVDKTFAEFRKWLQANIPDQRRLEKCNDATDDDARLWIQRPNPVVVS
jgi:hypothetical protein